MQKKRVFLIIGLCVEFGNFSYGILLKYRLFVML